MSDYLKQAQALAGKLPFQDAIKLHTRQCSRLQEKLVETMKSVESCRLDKVRRNIEVFKELHLVVQKVKRFIEDCCYENDNDFILAAIRVTAHKERFFQYHVELDWCFFLVQCLADSEANGEPVYVQTLEHGFDWEHKFTSILRDTSLIAEDERELKDRLKEGIKKPGQHQAICRALLRRFRVETDDLPDNLGVPPFTDLGKRIGSGGFGEVFELKWKRKLFAVKVFAIGDVATINTEVKILEECCHPHIVNLILGHKKDGKQILMMERLSMDLQSYIERRKNRKAFPFTPVEVVDLSLQVCEGMLYLNSDDKKVSHRDLKPKNILVKEDPVLELQVADFGLAKEREKGLERASKSENTPNRGTTTYRAPEMTEWGGQPCKIRGMSSMKADMYSFAVTCSWILTGCAPYGDCANLEKMVGFVKGGKRPVLPDDCPEALSTLLQKCWDPEPSRRPGSFSAIRTELRKLKANLLTGAVDRGQCHPEGEPQEILGVTFNSRDRPLRILVLGDSGLVESAVSQICGAVRPHIYTVPNHVNLTESRSSSPPMRLYRSTQETANDFTVIQTFVKARNNRWHQKQVTETLWIDDLHGGKRPAVLFPDSDSRLHMVWYVCRTIADLPNTLKWPEITKQLYGLPVQILVSGRRTIPDLEGLNSDGNSEFDKIFLRYGSPQHFPNGQTYLEKLIVKIDPTVGDWKEELWSTCCAVKRQAEIENAAMIIAWIRKKLGSGGKSFTVGVAAKTTKKFSLLRSGEFVLQFLCTYWEVPIASMRDVLRKMTAFHEHAAEKGISNIQPGEFVMFCLQVAAIILYSAGNPEYVYSWVPAESSSQELEKEARGCYDSYFKNPISPSAYDQMTDSDMRAFLQSIFQRKEVPCPLASVGRNSSSKCSKIMKFLRDKGLRPKNRLEQDDQL